MSILLEPLHSRPCSDEALLNTCNEDTIWVVHQFTGVFTVTAVIKYMKGLYRLFFTEMPVVKKFRLSRKRMNGQLKVHIPLCLVQSNIAEPGTKYEELNLALKSKQGLLPSGWTLLVWSQARWF